MKRIYILIFIAIISSAANSQSTKIDSLLNAIETQNDTEQIKSYWLITREQAKTDSTQAANSLEKMGELVKRNNANLNQAMLAHAKAYINEFYGDINDAIGFYDEALRLFEKSGSSKYAGEVANDLTFVHGQLQNNRISLEYAKKAKNLFLMSTDTINLLGAYSNLGRLYTLSGSLDSALIYLYEGSKIIDSYNTPSNLKQKFSINAANLLNNTGIAYVQKGQADKGVEFYQKALKIRIDQKDTVEIANMYLNIGGVDFENNNFKRARAYLDSASAIFTKKQHTPGVILCKTNGAAISILIEEYSKAISYAKKGLKLSLEIDDKNNIATNNIHLGRAYGSIGNKNLADKYFNEALLASKDLASKTLESEVYEAKYQVALKNSDFESALLNRNNYFEIRDQMAEEKKSRDISELETQYKTRQKEQQIALQDAQLLEKEAELQRNQILLAALLIALVLLVTIGILQKNRLKKKQQLKLKEAELRARESEINATISSQEKERARYARDLHDGFGQMISVLNMNLKNLEEGAKPDERQKVFENSSKVIDEMYGELKNICFDLMPQTLIKHGLESALNEFAGRINLTGKIFVELNIFGLNERLTELQEISLYRISQEWINNILKYSDADKIILQITCDESEITLLIEDNGAGFDQSLLEQGKGNGWRNLNTRAKLIHGELELETSLNNKGNVLIVNAPSAILQREDVDQNTIQTV
ncbi:MAG: tetratricopeptide repeat protein [Ekhidna sp.]